MQERGKAEARHASSDRRSETANDGAGRTPGFDEFLRKREEISSDYINGKGASLQTILTTQDPTTFFSPGGTCETGASNVAASHDAGAKAFEQGSSGRFEILQSGASGNLAFWTGYQIANVRMKGKQEPVAMTLRTTEVFRLEEGEWKLVHRHADFAKQSLE